MSHPGLLFKKSLLWAIWKINHSRGLEEDRKKAVGALQVGGDGGLPQAGSNGGGEKRLDLQDLLEEKRLFGGLKELHEKVDTHSLCPSPSPPTLLSRWTFFEKCLLDYEIWGHHGEDYWFWSTSCPSWGEGGRGGRSGWFASVALGIFDCVDLRQDGSAHCVSCGRSDDGKKKSENSTLALERNRIQKRLSQI